MYKFSSSEKKNWSQSQGSLSSLKKKSGGDYHWWNFSALIPWVVYKRHHGLWAILTIRAFLDDLADVVDEVDLKACGRPVDSSIV